MPKKMIAIGFCTKLMLFQKNYKKQNLTAINLWIVREERYWSGID